MLAYSGGLISGLLVIVLVRHDGFARFHAMQSIVTFSTLLVAHLLLGSFGTFGSVARVPFFVSVVVLWIYLMVCAWRGQRYHLPVVGAFAEHLLK